MNHPRRYRQQKNSQLYCQRYKRASRNQSIRNTTTSCIISNQKQDWYLTKPLSVYYSSQKYQPLKCFAPKFSIHSCVSLPHSTTHIHLEELFSYPFLRPTCKTSQERIYIQTDRKLVKDREITSTVGKNPDNHTLSIITLECLTPSPKFLPRWCFPLTQNLKSCYAFLG